MLRRIPSPLALIGLGVLVAAAVFELAPTPSRTPGFHRDAASAAYNAWSIGHDLHDQDGRLLPLFFVSYGGYLSPLFPYLEAIVFKVFWPSNGVARELTAVLVLAALLVVAAVVRRATGRWWLGLSALVAGVLTPWLYEFGRTGTEIAIFPLAIALVLLAVQWAYRSPAPAVLRGLVVALALTGLTYSYAGGRALAPLYAVALLAFARRGRMRWLVTAWVAFAVALVPLAIDHQAAAARYHQTTFVQPGMSWWRIVVDFCWNYLRDVNPWLWITSGDPQPAFHTAGAGSLFASVVVLAAIGAVVAWRSGDRWWRWVVVCLVLSPIPAALTEDRAHSGRLLPLPVLLLVLAAPGLLAVLSVRLRVAAAAAAVVLAAGVVAQVWVFEHWFGIRGAQQRLVVDDAGVPPLLQQGFKDGNGTIYIDHDDRYAQTLALWYAVSHHLPTSSVSILHDGWPAPNGASAFGRFQSCDYPCKHYAESVTYWLARSEQPAS